ncbi:uncharacterized protein LOC116349192 [Contarinia nasturtii]|uniref:uncharacterized protein LOC116349192 n=1 Tax=Contarinia nasturtii TaxID=265458 RepID=UPI0012D4781D|nr:uncharacterized protein LOC116349192 [Contarinia nasturtii]
MFKIFLKFCICISIGCHSVFVPEFERFDLQDVIKSVFEVNYNNLKQKYLTEIKNLKGAKFSQNSEKDCNVTEKIQLLNRAFTRKAEDIKDLHKQVIKMFDRRYHTKSIDSIVEYFEEAFSDFCNFIKGADWTAIFHPLNNSSHRTHEKGFGVIPAGLNSTSSSPANTYNDTESINYIN